MTKSTTGKRGAQLSRCIAAARKDLSDCQQARDELLLQLASTPSNKKLQTQLDDVEAEIAIHEKTLRRFEAAETEALRRDSADARKARHERVRKETASVDDLAAKLQADVEKLLLDVTDLGGRFAAIQEDRERLFGALKPLVNDVFRDVGPNNRHKPVYRLAEQLDRAIDQLTAAPYVEAAIADSGLARVGVQMPRIEIYRTSRPVHDIEYAFAEGRRQLREVVESVVAQSAQQVQEVQA